MFIWNQPPQNEIPRVAFVKFFFLFWRQHFNYCCTNLSSFCADFSRANSWKSRNKMMGCYFQKFQISFVKSWCTRRFQETCFLRVENPVHVPFSGYYMKKIRKKPDPRALYHQRCRLNGTLKFEIFQESSNCLYDLKNWNHFLIDSEVWRLKGRFITEFEEWKLNLRNSLQFSDDFRFTELLGFKLHPTISIQLLHPTQNKIFHHFKHTSETFSYHKFHFNFW